MPNFDCHPYDPEEWGPYQPKGRVRWRHTHLLREAIELYEAQSHLVWRYGEFFNTHITITAGLMGIIDHREFAALMPQFNKEARRWLALGNDKRRRRWPRWLLTKEPQEHYWIYVLEHGRCNGLHAHQLCVVPKRQRRAFSELVRDWWWRKACLDIPEGAIKIRYFSGQTDKARYERHVEWFRYVIKSVNRDVFLLDADGLPQPIEAVLKPEPYWPTMPIYAPQLYGVSRNLGPQARREPLMLEGAPMHFRSALSRRRFKDVYGWEAKDRAQWPARALIALMQS